MREAQHERGKSESALETALSHCLMDSDAESLRLARRTRRRSMLLSTGIQVALLSAAVVAPLLAGETLPLIINDPPIPAPRGIRLAPVPPAVGNPVHNAGRRKPRPGFFQPIEIPKDIPPVNDVGNRGAPEADIAGNAPIGVPDGIPGLNLPQYDHDARPPAPIALRDEQPRGPVIVSKGAQAAKLIYKVEPRYPALARQIRLEGNVELRAIIATDGTVQNLEVVSGHPLFIEATLQAVRQWRYQPTLLSDKPVEVQTYITVIFRLSRN